jgi:hypothetical protein
MNLCAARELKQQVAECVALSQMRHAVSLGISVTRTPGMYRVAILPHSHRDGRFVESRMMCALLRSAGRYIDVEVMGKVMQSSGRADLPQAQTTLALGTSVGHFTGGDGSLGFFAVQRSTGRLGLVSCNHALALADQGADGDDVISPSGSNGGRTPRNRVATLDGRYPRLGGPGQKLTDCAFAILDEGIPYDASRVEGGRLIGVPASVVEQLEVTKIGWVTNARTGVVAKIEVDNVPVRYGEVKAFFHDVIQIGSTSSVRFAARGDSGALVYTTSTFQPVGLLFAASDAGGPYNAGWAWAHPIEHVTRALDVELSVT